MSIRGSRARDLSGVISAEPVLSRRGKAAAAGSVQARLSVAFLAFFALCLVLPLFETLYPLFGSVVRPLDERRAADPFPAPRLLLRATGAFAAGLEHWFDDRVGFRDLFIRTKNQIDYSLFSTSRKVYVGADGWLFDRSDPGLAIERLDAAGLAALEERFLALARRLGQKGIRLIVVGYPDKARVYPEMLPAAAPAMPREGNDAALRRFLRRQSALDFIDAEAIIRRTKAASAVPVYYRTDLHANEIGQLPVVEAIVARIARLAGRPDVRWHENFAQAMQKWGPGSDGRALALLAPVHETAPYFKGGYTIGGAEPDGTWTIPDRRVFDSADPGIGRPFDWEFRSRPELCRRRLPGMVIFGNSFSDYYWALGLHRYFCFIRRARNPISRFSLFYDTMPKETKYFIFEYYLPWVIQDAPPLD